MPDADWLAALRAECEASSQRKVAERLGISATAVNQALNGTYTARTDRIEQLVRQTLMTTPTPTPPAAPTRGDWLAKLRTSCAETSQTEVAWRLGISTTTVSQVLAGKYGASTRRVELLVRAHLMGERLDCPAMSRPIPIATCLEQSSKVKRRLTGGITGALGFDVACPKCPNNPHRTEASR